MKFSSLEKRISKRLKPTSKVFVVLTFKTFDWTFNGLHHQLAFNRVTTLTSSFNRPTSRSLVTLLWLILPEKRKNWDKFIGNSLVFAENRTSSILIAGAWISRRHTWVLWEKIELPICQSKCLLTRTNDWPNVFLCSLQSSTTKSLV